MHTPGTVPATGPKRERPRFPVAAPTEERLAAARKAIADAGHTVATWARAQGFRESAVYDVLGGTRACVKGDALKIATALGLKDPPPAQLEPAA